MIEQVAVSPSYMVPGVKLGDDSVLQPRRFSYPRHPPPPAGRQPKLPEHLPQADLEAHQADPGSR